MKQLLMLAGLGLTLLSQVAQAELVIDGAYVRATPPNAQNSAAFLQLSNHSTELATLVSVSSSRAKKVELHNHLLLDGMMKMRQVESIEVAPMATVALQPGGYHIMLMGLTEPLVVGQEVSFTLTLLSGEELTFVAPVKSIKAKQPKMKHDH